MPTSYGSLSESKKIFYEGYFDKKVKLVSTNLSNDDIRYWLSKLKGERVISGSLPYIGKIRESGEIVEIEEPKSDHIQPVPIIQILNADKIILYWLTKGKCPVQNIKKQECDWYSPHQDIGVQPVSNRTYAPRLAQKIRINIKHEQNF